MASAWCWFLITVLLILEKEYTLALNHFNTNGLNIKNSASVNLKKCCWENSKSGHNCTDVLSIPWNVLKFYREPKETGGYSPVFNEIEPRNSMQDNLSCNNYTENVLRLSVPLWKEDRPSKSFFSYFSPDGYLQYSGYAFSYEEYCIERVTPEVITVVACDYTSLCSQGKDNENETDSYNYKGAGACLYRCCNYGEVWDISSPTLRCKDSGVHKWKPSFYYDLSSDDVISEENETGERPVIVSLHPRDLIKSCKSMYTFQNPNTKIREDERLKNKFGKKQFKILTNGTVWMNIRKREWVQMHPGEYCVDGFQMGEGSYTGDSVRDAILFECKVLESVQKAQGIERQRKYSLTFGVILFFCLLFLLMTTIVYILLWSKHNIHGWTVFSYITTLLITYLLLGISHFASVILVRKPETLDLLTFCGILGILCHFAFLCTFSWSTVLSYDLFCTFRKLKPRRQGKSNGLKKFLLYCIFAFIAPSIIVTVGILLDIIYIGDSYVITPEYGKSVCYVEPRYARFYFVILPIASFLGINFTMFCNTAYSVYKVKKSTQFASSSSTKKGDNQTFLLILKLFLVNGTVWVVEIISWYLQDDYDEVGMFSFLLDVVNVLQAVVIFFLFVFKNDILESLKKKYPCLKGTVNAAFKLKNLGSTKEQQVPTTSTDTSYNVKVNENVPISSL